MHDGRLRRHRRGGQGGSDSNAPAGQTANGVQTAEVAGFTIESVGDGSYYRGAAERQDGFWLRVKITNNNESAKTPSAFSARAAVGTFDAGDAVFDASGDQRLNADTKTQAVELGEGAQMDANAKIEPGQSVEFIYFWTTKDNLLRPDHRPVRQERHGRHRPAHHALRHHRQGNRRL